MAEIKKYLDTTALGTLVDQIKAEDAKVLAAANKAAEDLGKNYDTAGAAATAESNAKAYTDTLANGAVKANTEAIAKLNGDATTDGSVAKAVADAKTAIDADIDAVETVANKNAEDIAAINHAETGILAQAKAHTNTEVEKVQGEVDALEEVVQNIQENAYDDTEVRGLISGLEAGKADKTQVAADIAAAVKVETDARVEAIAGVQTAVEAAQAAADKAQGEVDALEQAHATDKAALEGKDAELLAAINAEVERAGNAEGALEDRIETMEAFWEAAKADGDEGNVIDTLKEIQEYIAGDETGASEMAASIKQNKDAIEAMDTAYKAADATLQGNIDALTQVVNTKAAAADVEALDGRVDGIDESIAALEGADAGQIERIAALEAKFGEGEGSVADMVADAKQGAIDAAAAAADTKDAEILAQAKKYADDEDARVEARVEALETASATHALKTEVEAVAQRMTAAEGEIDTLQSEMDAVEALAAANKAAHEANAAAIALKASQADLEAAVARIAQNETDIEALEGAVATKAEQDDLDAAVERIAKNETDIAANTSAINSFTAITSDEVNALFA